MSFFTKKPVTIEAFRWTGGPDQQEDPEWICAAIAEGTVQFVEAGLMSIQTLEGVHLANPGDWIIRGIEGELYPCKDSIFQATYAPARPAEHRKSFEGGGRGLTFGQALEQLKDGDAVARDGWNGKGMFIVLMPALYLPPFNTQDTARKVNDRTAKWIGEDKPLDCQPYIAMWTADGKWQPGWVCSQADMLAEDWCVVRRELATA